MAINWFPGHMHKARKEVKKLLKNMDVIIEIIDARIPYSSSNPLIEQFIHDKYIIKIMNKADLADDKITEEWIQFFKAHDNMIAVLPLFLDKENIWQKISTICRQLVQKKLLLDTINVMVLGIPNVGKSTLINALSQRHIAKTGNEAAVTRGIQKVKWEDDLLLFDTPGMLWPKLQYEDIGFLLSAVGSIKDTAFEYPDVASYLSEYLLKNHAHVLQNRYQINIDNLNDYDFLLQAGKKRGCIVSGGRVDLDKFSKILINEFRSGMLGRLSLERPGVEEKYKKNHEIV